MSWLQKIREIKKVLLLLKNALIRDPNSYLNAVSIHPIKKANVFSHIRFKIIWIEFLL